MIELPRTPVRGIVAVIALLAETATVWILIDMTGHARAVDIVISRCRVASIAS